MWTPIVDASALPPLLSEESEVLDFKRDPWDKGDKGYNELARDVAQFANHLGGSIIVGANENDDGRCTGYVNVPDPGAVVSWIADVCHEALSPRADVRAAVIKVDNLQIVVVNVSPQEGVVANKLKGTERWEFKRRYGKNKRTLTFEEVESMWTEGRKGRVLLGKIPDAQLRNVRIDVVEGHGIHLHGPFTVQRREDCFVLSLTTPGPTYNLPYEAVRAVWPDAHGGWSAALDVEVALDAGGQMRVKYTPRN